MLENQINLHAELVGWWRRITIKSAIAVDTHGAAVLHRPALLKSINAQNARHLPVDTHIDDAKHNQLWYKIGFSWIAWRWLIRNAFAFISFHHRNGTQQVVAMTRHKSNANYNINSYSYWRRAINALKVYICAKSIRDYLAIRSTFTYIDRNGFIGHSIREWVKMIVKLIEFVNWVVWRRMSATLRWRC